ncbi:MAG: GAF domain-containing protein [Chitinophagaceae bacterium]
MIPNIPTEAKRLADLHELEVLRSPYEPEFDAIVAEAAAICDVPIALISLVADNFQWFKAKTGLEAEETPREVSFCAHAIAQDNIFIVENALADAKFSQNPLVLDSPNIRFYAGAPLALPGGSKIGTLCIIDNKPRTLGVAEQQLLQVLSRQVVQLLLHRKALLGYKFITQQATVLSLQASSRQLIGSGLHEKAGIIGRSITEQIDLIREGKFTRKTLSAFCDDATGQVQTLVDLCAAAPATGALPLNAQQAQHPLYEQINALLAIAAGLQREGLQIHNDIDNGLLLAPAHCLAATLVCQHLLIALAALPDAIGEIELYATSAGNNAPLQLSFLLTGFNNEQLLQALVLTREQEAANPLHTFSLHFKFVHQCLDALYGNLVFNALSKKRMLIAINLPS